MLFEAMLTTILNAVGLGNAYSSLFFSVSFLQSDLLKSLKCLNKSLTFPPCAQHADIYYSRGSLHHYMENYLPALEDYERALKLDPTIMSGNAVGVVGILGYLGRVEDAVIKKVRGSFWDMSVPLFLVY